MLMIDVELKDSTQRVLDVAEALFIDRGYNAITLRDIADELGIKQASLYYHFPGGKEQLFMAMAERLFAHHREGLEAALLNSGDDLRSQLRAVVQWFGSQRPVKILGMFHADMPALSADHIQMLGQAAREALYLPLRQRLCGRGGTRRDPAHAPGHAVGQFSLAHGRAKLR